MTQATYSTPSNQQQQPSLKINTTNLHSSSNTTTTATTTNSSNANGNGNAKYAEGGLLPESEELELEEHHNGDLSNQFYDHVEPEGHARRAVAAGDPLSPTSDEQEQWERDRRRRDKGKGRQSEEDALSQQQHHRHLRSESGGGDKYARVRGSEEGDLDHEVHSPGLGSSPGGAAGGEEQEGVFPPPLGDEEARESKRVADNLANWSRLEKQRRASARRSSVLVLPSSPLPTITSQQAKETVVSLGRRGSRLFRRGSIGSVVGSSGAEDGDGEGGGEGIGMKRRTTGRKERRKGSERLRDLSLDTEEEDEGEAGGGGAARQILAPLPESTEPPMSPEPPTNPVHSSSRFIEHLPSQLSPTGSTFTTTSSTSTGTTTTRSNNSNSNSKSNSTLTHRSAFSMSTPTTTMNPFLNPTSPSKRSPTTSHSHSHSLPPILNHHHHQQERSSTSLSGSGEEGEEDPFADVIQRVNKKPGLMRKEDSERSLSTIRSEGTVLGEEEQEQDESASAKGGRGWRNASTEPGPTTLPSLPTNPNLIPQEEEEEVDDDHRGSVGVLDWLLCGCWRIPEDEMGEDGEQRGRTNPME
ncbi:hypothetical protein T439DRAFT_329067 [Meredithblackwellia eburnea MCA 4105]